MLLVMRNLPSDIKYSDIKSLIENKCFVSEVILDKLFKDGPTTKKVTIGVAKEEDATRIKHRLNGTYIGGLQIYIEDMNKSKSRNNSTMSIQSDYQGRNDQGRVQAAGHQQSSQGPMMGMYQYGYGMSANQTAYQTQQGTNQQGMSQQMMSYSAWMTPNNSGVAPLMQNSFTGYGNQQGRQGQQSTSQGQFGGSGPGSQAMGVQKELGFGYTGGHNQNDRERGHSNERGYSAQPYQSGNPKDRGSQGSWRDPQQDRGRGSQSWSSSDNLRRGSQQPPNERGYGSGNFDRSTSFGSGNSQNDSRGYGSQQPFNRNSSNSGGFDRWRDGDDRGDRKRQHSPEREDRYRGNSRDRFQGGSSKFEGNQGRGFDSNRDSRDSYNRAGPSRDSYSAKPTLSLEKPSGPYSWSNGSNTSSRFNDNPRSSGGYQSSFEGKPRPFGEGQSRSFDDKPRPYGGPNYNKDQGNNGNDSKSRLVWNSKYQFMSQNFQAQGPPEKRPKTEAKPSVNAVVFDQKSANRAISWRGEGVSMLAKEILKNQGPNNPLLKRGQQPALKLLKKALNNRVEELIKQKYPNDPHPQLHVPEIVKLYRETYPGRTDAKLCASCDEEAPVTGPTDNKESKPNIAPPASTVRPIATPSATNAPQAKPREVKPFIKPFAKPKLSDLLPPQVMQRPLRPKLMLGPNALKKKPKPYNVEKRAKAEQRQLTKREFLEENMYKCPTPAMEKALNAVLDEITDVFNNAVDEHPTKTKEEKLIGETIKLKTASEFRAMVRLHTIKRILNITRTLMLRIFVSPGKATKDNVEQALKNYGLLNLKSSSRAKTPMFMAGVKTYYNYDRLCTTPGIPVAGKKGPAMITAKPLYLTIPFKFRRLLRQKKYVELTGDDENDDFGRDAKDDDDDDDDDGDDGEPGDDDDVVDVTKDNDVIELSGDETLHVPDETKDEKSELKTEADTGVESVNGANKSMSNEKAVDLTMEDEVDLTVDEKMSAAIAEEMGDSVVEIDEDEIREDDLEDY